MTKILRIWLLMMALGATLSAQAQMKIKDLPVLYYGKNNGTPLDGTQEVPVYHNTTDGKYYLKNVPDPANPNPLPKIETRFSVDYANPTDPTDDYEYYDLLNNGMGPYIIDIYLVDGIDAVSAYWVASQVFEYYYTRFNYIGCSNNPAEVVTLRIVENPIGGAAAVSGITPPPYNTCIFFNSQFKSYTLDVLGHETAHQIMKYRGMEYTTSGIEEIDYLHESMADAFGILAKNYYLKKKNPNTDWTIKSGPNLLFCDASSAASIKKAGYPTTYQGTNYDGLGKDAHNNSTLIPYWLYLLSQGEWGYIDEDSSKGFFSVTGIGIDHAEKILWRTMTEFLPPYGQTMTWLNFREAAEKAAIAQYGANSLELSSVQDACYAIGIGSSSLQLLPSFPADGAKDVNPWPVVLTQKIQEYPFLEHKSFAINISTTPSFGPGYSFYTIKNEDITYDAATGTITTKPIANLNLQPNTIYYWHLTSRVVCNEMNQTPTICTELEDKFSNGLEIRSFITDGREVANQHIEHPYPWGIPFFCDAKD